MNKTTYALTMEEPTVNHQLTSLIGFQMAGAMITETLRMIYSISAKPPALLDAVSTRKIASPYRA
jgi:hypothetical protein